MVERVPGETKMQSGKLWRVLGLCVLSVGVWGQEGQEDNGQGKEDKGLQYEVSIKGENVTLKCLDQDESANIKWEKNDKEIKNEVGQDLVLNNFSEMDSSGYYRCYTENNKKNSDYLYLKARVCQNCVEMEMTKLTIIILADLCITLGVLLGVYYWSKNRKAKAKPVTRAPGTGGQPKGQNKKSPPPVPSPDYEPIRKGQRDVYSGLNHRGI